MSESEIEEGDLVRTKPSAPMTVEKVVDEWAVCVWFDGSTVQRTVVPLAALERFDPPPLPCSLAGFAAETPGSWRDREPLA